MKRYGSVIGLTEEGKAEYCQLHASVWPRVLDRITACGIRNYTIFLKEPENLLFSYFEYCGTDFAVDMSRMTDDPETQAWLAITMPLQRPFESRRHGEWWASMNEVFHAD